MGTLAAPLPDDRTVCEIDGEHHGDATVKDDAHGAHGTHGGGHGATSPVPNDKAKE